MPHESFTSRQIQDHPENVIVVQPGRLSKFYVFLVKEMFFNEKHELLELHAVGNDCILSLSMAVEKISRFGYAEVAKIKTKTVIVENYARVPKLIVHLRKTSQFEERYTKFKEDLETRFPYQAKHDKDSTQQQINEEDSQEESDHEVPVNQIHEEQQEEEGSDQTHSKLNSATQEIKTSANENGKSGEKQQTPEKKP